MEQNVENEVVITQGVNEELLDSSNCVNWDYKADLAQLENMVSKSTKMQRSRVRSWITGCLSFLKNPELGVNTHPFNGELNSEEARSNSDNEELFNSCRNALEIDLIVQLICSFTSSVEDLLNFRRINHVFQREASRRFRDVQKHVVIKTEASAKSLMNLAKNREMVKLSPFPLSALKVHLNLKRETLESFATTFGHHIKRYSFRIWRYEVDSAEIGSKAAMLLSHSPQLTELQFDKLPELHIFEDDFLRLPASFPELSVIEIIDDDDTSKEIKPENAFLLSDVMVSRAINVNKLKFAQTNPTLTMRILRSLAESRPNNLPHFPLSINYPPILNPSQLEEILSNNLVLTDVSICLIILNTESALNMLQRMGTYLESQSNNLTYLNLVVNPSYEQISFPFPSLLALRKLRLIFINLDRDLDWPVLPFVGNPCPSLRVLNLDSIKEHKGLFEACSMPSVQELHLHQRRPLTNPCWRNAFPNLTTLHVVFDSDKAEVIRSMLSYILTHLTGLVHLDLKLIDFLSDTRCRMPDWCNWDLLTGGAPSSVREFVVKSGLVHGAEPEGEPLNGIYQVPSLRNMRALKTYRFFPRIRSNLDAILFMTQNMLLVPLEQLVLCNLPRDTELILTEDELRPYIERLSRVHAKVILSWGKDNTDKCYK